MFIMARSRISSTGKAIYGVMTHMEHWYWQISHSTSRNKIDQMPTGILLVYIIGKCIKQIKNGCIILNQEEISVNEPISRTKPVCRL